MRKRLGLDEIYFGKQMKFITVVSNLESGEPLLPATKLADSKALALTPAT